MIADKFVDLYARNSGLRDKLIAERDVVLTYALRALVDAGVMDHLAFKGGTCLRKLVFGSAGRFSEDLDFTIDSAEPDDDVLMRLVETFNREHFGIAFTLDEYYKTDGDTSFGGDVTYRHSWNDAGRFRLQVSLRERPTLVSPPTSAGPISTGITGTQGPARCQRRKALHAQPEGCAVALGSTASLQVRAESWKPVVRRAPSVW